MRRKLLAALLLAGLGASLSGCGASRAYRRGNREAKSQNWDAAVVHYTRAARENPDKIEYRMALQRALIEASAIHIKKAREHLAAEDLEKAREELQLATQLDPTNQSARDDLLVVQKKLREREELRREASEFEERRARARQQLPSPEPVLEPASTAPINLKFAQDTSLQKIFEVLSKLSGINILFDEGFRDKRVTIDLVDVSFKEALDKLVLINRLFYKVLDPSTIIIIPDNAQKRRQYDDLVLRTFYLTNAEVNTIANMFRTIAGIQRVQPNPELGAITVRATPDQVAVAERIIELNDKRKAEVILDIEILEVNRSKMLEFGLRAAEYQVGQVFAPAGSTVSAQGVTSVRLNRLAAADSSDYLITIPSVLYQFSKTASEARVLATPKLRASEGKKADLKIGEEIPVPVTSFLSPFFGAGTPQQPGGGLAATPVTSFQYRNVGINVSITPKVRVDGEIELEVSLESSSIARFEEVGGARLPVFGTRNISNVIRLRDGETNLIGGLIRQTDRKTIAGLPGITDIPILSYIFSSNARTIEDSDVVFSITPHLVRAPKITESDLAPLPMGTEQHIQVPSIRPPVFGPPSPPEEKPPEAAPPAAAPAPPAEPTPPAEAPPAPTEAPRPEVAPAETAPAPAGPPPAEPAPAPGPISVLLSPPTVTAAAGQRVELALIAGGAVALSSGEMDITFDPAALEAVEIQAGPFLSIDGREVTFVPVIEAGRIRIQFSRKEDPVGLRGSGQIARMVFRVLSAGPPRAVAASGTLKDPAGGQIAASFASAQIVTQ